MLIFMRTTLVFDDRLLREAKREASKRGVTLSELVSRALRSELAQRAKPAGRYEMITFGAREPRTHHEPRDFAEAIAADDARALR